MTLTLQQERAINRYLLNNYKVDVRLYFMHIYFVCGLQPDADGADAQSTVRSGRGCVWRQRLLGGDERPAQGDLQEVSR